MSISHSVARFLGERDVDFEVITHPHTDHSQQTAQAAHVPGDRLAKAVLLHDQEDYVLVVLPATHRVDPFVLQNLLQRPLSMVEEDDLPFVFRDCERGAVPAVGIAFGVTTIVDDALLAQDPIYFDGGDHEHLVGVSSRDFRRLMDGAQLAHFSYHA